MEPMKSLSISLPGVVTYSASKTLADRPAGGPTHAMTNGHSFPFFPKRIEEEEEEEERTCLERAEERQSAG